jgi:hypothetical protein
MPTFLILLSITVVFGWVAAKLFHGLRTMEIQSRRRSEEVSEPAALLGRDRESVFGSRCGGRDHILHGLYPLLHGLYPSEPDVS